MNNKIVYGLCALVLILSVWLNISMMQKARHPAGKNLSPIINQKSQKETPATETSDGTVSTSVFVPDMPTQVKAQIKK